ncbi:MAG TPA: hypothetical protein VMT53_18710 [Terriglobales bacterium]|nr:hypothetical protein [Terriglobales bacterium]
MKPIFVSILFLSTTLFAQVEIPAGTILPAQLESSLNSRKSKPGQRVSARIVQDVPLPSGKKIRAGAKIEGHVEAVKAASAGQGAQITLCFDQLKFSHRNIRLTTSLRALASMMDVADAQVPATGPDRGTPWTWNNRTLIGGEVAYGEGGPVERGTQRVGRALVNGVLSPTRANPERGCPGEAGDGTRAQALWVFSSDACGVYGLEDVQVNHAGRMPPIGEITLNAKQGDFNVRSGSGLLLQVLA